MKYQSMIKFVTGAGLVLGSVNAMAGGFGGGWAHDSTGTLSNSNPHTVISSPETKPRAKSNSFGGGWAHDSTGTISKSDPHTVISSPKPKSRAKSSTFGGGWAHDDTGTITRYM